jgi:tetratricopeptide (TPR) repeat protein
MVEADVEHRRGHHQRALDLSERALELDDRLLEARLDRCRYLAALDRSSEAAQELEPLLAEHPDNNLVALRYGEIVELGSRDYPAAERRLRAAVARNPNLTEAWALLGTALTRAGRPADAVAAYREAIAVGAANPDLSARLALLLAESADPGAETALRDAIRASPAPRADLHVALGEDLAEAGRSQEARQQFEFAARAPVFSDGTGNAKAMALLQLGRADEAEDLWTQLTRTSPDYAKAWLNLSSLSIQRRDWAAVERFARVATENDPGSSPAWNNLAIGLEELGRTGEAETTYRRAIETDPTDWRAAFNLGILLRKSQRYAEAAAVQEGVLSLAPRHAGAHFELGVLYAGPLGDIERAKVHLQATIGADPNHPRARQARAVLDQISGSSSSR